jgi:hypothetical protein
MRIKLIFWGILLVFFSSCSSPKYLTSAKAIGVNPHGSHIRIHIKKGPNIEGELIAIDTNYIVVLVADSNQCRMVPVQDAKKFILQYAKPKNYYWAIPLYTLSTISHGLFLFITAPLNILVTTIVAVNGETAFVYNNKNLTFEQLKMFARFPQGIPESIDISQIN